jgi:beta-glucoside operon transcriptional antiterminator
VTVPSARFIVQRVHNNNVVLALDSRDRSVVITGPGIGFGMTRGVVLDPERIEIVYVPDNAARAEVAAGTLAAIPSPVLDTARAIVDAFERAQESGGEGPGGSTVSDVLMVPVADHLHQAVRRAEEGIEIEMPLVWEVRNLYPRETRIGQEALAIIERRLGVRLPAQEATAFALHFVSVSFSQKVIDRTVLMTQSLTDIFTLIDSSRGRPLDRDGAAAARFVTHLRYLFTRLAEGRAVADAPQLLQDALENGLPDAMPIAREVSAQLSESWGHDLSSSETAYIGLHIHRLLAESADAPPTSGGSS